MSGPIPLVLQTFCFSNPNPTAKPGQELVNDCYPIKFPTVLVFILECAAGWQADWHQLAFGKFNLVKEEWPVKLDEGDVMVASVQLFWFVSLVDNYFFNAPGINYIKRIKKSINIC